MRIILIGGDDTVYYLARQLKKHQHHVTIINRNEQQCHDLFVQTNATVIHGEGSNKATLESAGARQADVVLALTPYDHDNLIACQVAQKLFGVPRTIALVNDPDNEEVFEKLGVTLAFSSTRIIANLIEQHATFENIRRVMPVGEGMLTMSDIRLDRGSPAIGKTLNELPLSNNSLIACIVRDEEVIIPRGSNQLHVGDHLLVISKPEAAQDDLQLLTGDTP